MSNSTKKLQILKFFLPSIFGLWFFIFPIKYNGITYLPISLSALYLKEYLGDILIWLIVIGFSASLILTLFGMLSVSFIKKNDFLKSLFCLSKPLFIIRFLGIILFFMVFFNIGPQKLIDIETGGEVFYGLLPSLFCNLTISSFAIGLIIEFGLLEFIGELMNQFMRPLFDLPGSATIDCLVSWIGDGSMGTILTINQYKKKLYTQREAIILVTIFSAVSVSFCFLILTQIRLLNYFGIFYATNCLSGLVCALIIPKIYPLSKKKHIYIDGRKANRKIKPKIPFYKLLQQGWISALKKSEKQSFKKFILQGVKNILELTMGLLPTVMFVATLSLFVSIHTALLTILGKPFAPLMRIIGIKESEIVAQSLFIGFADMMIPSILISKVASPMTRFIIGVLSVSQLIYLSELGALILSSKLPIKLSELFIIFLERTIISFPIIFFVAKWYF